MIATSLISVNTILPEICAFIIGFSCTAWTKMRFLAGSFADGVLVDAIIRLPTNIRKGKGRRKSTENSNTKTK